MPKDLYLQKDHEKSITFKTKALVQKIFRIGLKRYSYSIRSYSLSLVFLSYRSHAGIATSFQIAQLYMLEIEISASGLSARMLIWIILYLIIKLYILLLFGVLTIQFMILYELRLRPIVIY